jgi:hypothetical protein
LSENAAPFRCDALNLCLFTTSFRYFAVLQLGGGTANAPPRKRFFEPSPYFLEHTLAVAETSIQLKIIGGKQDMEIIKIELEPECWRRYTRSDGKASVLKPDLFARTAAGEYEDNWFFEIDLASEAPSKILDKCRRYLACFRSGTEQKRTGVFPYVVWVIPSKARRDGIRRRVFEEFPRGPDIFLVIAPDELEPLVLNGAERFRTIQIQGDEKND